MAERNSVWVDYERAWLLLGKEIETKRSHGRDGLRNAMSRIQTECTVEESSPPSQTDDMTEPDTPEAAEAASGEMADPLPPQEDGNGPGHRHTPDPPSTPRSAAERHRHPVGAAAS